MITRIGNSTDTLFEDEHVILDGMELIRCTFRRCTFSGVAESAVDCFIEECRGKNNPNYAGFGGLSAKKFIGCVANKCKAGFSFAPGVTISGDTRIEIGRG